MRGDDGSKSEVKGLFVVVRGKEGERSALVVDVGSWRGIVKQDITSLQ